jgi:transcription elongation factor Elf1
MTEKKEKKEKKEKNVKKEEAEDCIKCGHPSVTVIETGTTQAPLCERCAWQLEKMVLTFLGAPDVGERALFYRESLRD